MYLKHIVLLRSCFGQSVSQHRTFLAKQVDVINRGYSGYNTRWAKYIAPVIFPASQKMPPQLVTVFFGANDAALPDRLRYYGTALSRLTFRLMVVPDDTLDLTQPDLCVILCCLTAQGSMFRSKSTGAICKV